MTKGGLTDLENLEIKAEGLYPMDFGEVGFTSFEGGQGWVDCFRQYPQVDPFKPQAGWYLGKIHSHHTMGVFHSATDVADLHATAPNLPMFLSVIVNYACMVDTELAIAGDVEETTLVRTVTKMRGLPSRREVVKKVEKPTVTYRMKCENFYEQEPWLIKATNEVATRKKEVVVYSSTKNQLGFEHNTQTDKVAPQYIYKPALDNIIDLITLGVGSQATPIAALRATDTQVSYKDLDDYKKAYKMYFSDTWRDIVFPNRQVLVSEIATALRQFYNLHKEVWLTTHLIKATNELETEYYKLRAL